MKIRKEGLLMSNINQIEQAYKEVNAMNQLNKVIVENLELTLLDVMIMKMAYDSKDFILKKDVEDKLSVSPSMSQKSTKQLRKNKYIIKDRDIDDESIVTIGMNDEMREQAKVVFEEVEKLRDNLNAEKQEKPKADADESQNQEPNQPDANAEPNKAFNKDNGKPNKHK